MHKAERRERLNCELRPVLLRDPLRFTRHCYDERTTAVPHRQLVGGLGDAQLPRSRHDRTVPRVLPLTPVDKDTREELMN